MTPLALQQALDSIPAGRYAIGVSGGADSVALLRLCVNRPELSLHIVHLDHQLRGDESTADAAFVESLARSHSLPITLARLDEWNPPIADLPTNPSAKYRRLRLALYQKAMHDHQLDAVLLAHHADDQAETILLKLLRGTTAALTGMQREAEVQGVRILRPLLNVSAEGLREYLRSIHQSWRDDSSNATDRYARNRVRHWLCAQRALGEELIQLAKALDHLRQWVHIQTPNLDPTFQTDVLADLPNLLAESAARQWLIGRGSPAEQIAPRHLAQLIQMARDLSSAHQVNLPGNRLVRRRSGAISCIY